MKNRFGEKTMEATAEKKENKMGSRPVKPLLLSMALPMILSMGVQALYNVVDSIFVSQLNEAALTAVSLAFPVQNLMIAVAVGTGVGINSLLSRKLGEQDFESANRTAVNGIFIGAVSYVFFALLGVLFSRTFFEMQLKDEQILSYGVDYLWVVMVFSVGLFMQIIWERLLQATGKMVCHMFAQVAGAVTNIILDPILIFGVPAFGIPRMEVLGAAIATVTGQILGMTLAIIFNLTLNKEIRLSFRRFRPNGAIIKGIYSVGLPSIVMQAIGSVMTFGMNKILLMFSTTAAAVFGAYFKLQSFIVMPVLGLNNAALPIVAYNYGARRPDRMKETIRTSIIWAVCLMLLGVLAFQLLPELMLSWFQASEDMLSVGVPALRIISLSFLVAGISIVLSGSFQALGNGVLSLLMSLCRQLIVILPLAYLFAKYFGLTAVWLAFPIAEIVSLLMGITFFRKMYREKIAPLEKEIQNGEEPA